MSQQSLTVNPLRLLSCIGPLRAALALLVLCCLPLAFFTDLNHRGWGILPSQIAPGLVVLLAWVLPFDMLLAKVFASEQPPHRRHCYRVVIAVDVILLLALLLFWGPFYLQLLN